MCLCIILECLWEGNNQDGHGRKKRERLRDVFVCVFGCAVYTFSCIWIAHTNTHTHMSAAQLTRDGLIVEADPANYIVTDQH